MSYYVSFWLSMRIYWANILTCKEVDGSGRPCEEPKRVWLDKEEVAWKSIREVKLRESFRRKHVSNSFKYYKGIMGVNTVNYPGDVAFRIIGDFVKNGFCYMVFVKHSHVHFLN